MPFTCAFCSSSKRLFSQYVKHLRLYHETQPKFSVVCNIDQCRNVFHKVRNLVRHVNQKHKSSEALRSVTLDDTNGTVENFGDPVAVCDDEAASSVSDEQETNATRLSVEDNVSDFRRHIASSVLKLREKHILTASVTQDVIDEMSSAVSCVHDTYKSVFRTFCADHNTPIEEDSVAGILLQDTSVYNDIFKGIDTDYKLNTFIRANFLYAAPVEYSLGHLPNGKPAGYQYIPLSDILKVMLSNSEVLHHVLSHQDGELESNDAMLSYVHGTVYEQHPFFSSNPNALRLHFYADEFEVCNPIGSKRGKHKVFAVYFLVGNLDRKYWSELKFIHLCILVRYQFIKEYDPTYANIFTPLIDELKLLSTQGFEVAVDGQSHKFHAALATFSADNLSAHSIAGFQRHFNQGRICRYCMANYDEIGTSFSDDKFCLRTKTVHNYHLAALESHASNASVYGVLHRCQLLDLSYFDVTQGFVPDIMHDVLEGIIPNLVAKVLSKALKDGIITVESLNTNLELASRNVRDRPNVFTKRSQSSVAVVGSASQKLQLFLLLPQIVGKYFGENDPTWHVYLLLRRATDIIFSHVVRKSSLSYLSGLINEFLSQFVAVFGVQELTPKHHYLTHYPRLMQMYGPLRGLWCMRYEAKHQYFKSVISSLGNYINVAASMASRHQMRQCYEYSNKDIFSEEPYALSGTTVQRLNHLPSDLRTALMNKLQVEVDSTEHVTMTKRLLSAHVPYAVNTCILLEVVEEEEIPFYFKVQYIINIRSTWLLCGRLCSCHRFNGHLHAFSVHIDDGWAIVYPGEEADHTSHNFFVQDGCTNVSQAYHVPPIGI